MGGCVERVHRPIRFFPRKRAVPRVSGATTSCPPLPGDRAKPRLHELRQGSRTRRASAPGLLGSFPHAGPGCVPVCSGELLGKGKSHGPPLKGCGISVVWRFVEFLGFHREREDSIQLLAMNTTESWRPINLTPQVSLLIQCAPMDLFPPKTSKNNNLPTSALHGGTSPCASRGVTRALSRATERMSLRRSTEASLRCRRAPASAPSASGPVVRPRRESEPGRGGGRGPAEQVRRWAETEAFWESFSMFGMVSRCQELDQHSGPLPPINDQYGILQFSPMTNGILCSILFNRAGKDRAVCRSRICGQHVIHAKLLLGKVIHLPGGRAAFRMEEPDDERIAFWKKRLQLLLCPSARLTITSKMTRPGMTCRAPCHLRVGAKPPTTPAWPVSAWLR